MKRSHLVLLILSTTFILKCVLGLLLPVAGDEAYYWVWGQHLQLSYYDHPGMVAWLSSLTNYVPFFPKWFSLRVIFSIISTLTFAVWIQNYLLLRSNEVDQKSLILFAVFFFTNPMLGVGGFIVTPDVPLLLFWALSFWSLINILIVQSKKHYALLGLFLGLGFCSKYHIVFFPLTALVGLLLTKKIRLIQMKYVSITFLFGLIFSSPVLIWNINNDFASFKFQLSHGLTSIYEYQFWWTYTYILGQIFLFNPFLFVNLIFTKLSLSNTTGYSQWLFFLYSSFKAKVEANWPVTSHAMSLIDLNYRNKKTIYAALAYVLVLYTALVFYFKSSHFSQKSLSLPTSKAIEIFYDDIKNISPVYGPTYQLSSLIQLMKNKDVYKLRDLSRFDFYDTVNQSLPNAEKFYVLKYDLTEWPQYITKFKIRIIKEYPDLKMKLYEIINE